MMKLTTYSDCVSLLKESTCSIINGTEHLVVGNEKHAKNFHMLIKVLLYIASKHYYDL